jgi:hypothetical protein
MKAQFSILDRLADSNRSIQCSAADLRILAYELESHGAYQIDIWRREADHGGAIEIVVTYETPK